MIQPTTDNTAILAKLKKIFALAASDNENEANEAAAKAQELLLKYNLSEEELNSFSLEKSEKVVHVYADGKNARNRSAWNVSLANVVARANLCNVLSSGPQIIWIGKPTNIEIARYIFDSLTRELERICEIKWILFRYNVNNRWNSTHGKTWKNSFYMGAVQGVSEKLNANLKQLKIDNTNLALVVVNNEEELEEYLNDKFKYRTPTKSSYTRDRSAFDQGKEAGKNVNVNRGVGAGGSHGPKYLKSGR
jgi:hypothetical protein